MTVKYFIIKIDFRPELDKYQHIQVLLNSKNELPTPISIKEANNNLWQKLELGNVFYKENDVQGVFANLPEETIKALSRDWKLIPLSNLQPENCPDYNIIVAGIKKAGYSLAIPA